MPDSEMTPQRYARVREIFSRVRRLPGAERAAVLAQECGADHALQREVESLLEHADTPLETQAMPEPLRRHVADLLRSSEAEIALHDVPEQVDGYHIRAVLGVGGMGAVFRAEQLEPVRRTVALKIIKLGMNSREIVARFASERQALALMDHPNVARVIDAGATPDGRPYFVMEFVPGEPITDYCARQRLDLTDRIELFITICSAVQHAHQKGIIHRDLKASNILVSTDGDAAVPKVIDFGIAKAVHQPLTPHATLTAAGRMIGTPEYMSPEQADSSGADVDTRTDVYALGVLLYRLLCGTLPFDSDTLRTAGLAGMARIIREQTPARPSARITADPQTGASAAAECGLEPAQLARTLRGDLDAITAKAMAKERELRYDSAAALADDLRRYLSNQPILARPPNFGYRARKLVQRHKAGVLAGVVAALGLVGAVAGVGVGYFHATAAESLARSEADAAQTARREAESALATAHTATARADAQTEELRRTLYAQQIALAQNAYQNDSVVRMRELLDASQPQRRGWEWNYLNWLADRSRLTLRAHAQDVRSVAVSTDGGTVLTGGYDRRILAWDADTGAIRFERSQHHHSVHCLAVQPGGAAFASGSYDGTVRVWKLPTGEPLRQLAPDQGEIWSVAFSTDGSVLYAGSQFGVITAWDVATGQRRFHIAAHRERVTGLTALPDGKRLISCSSDGLLRVWDTASGERLDTWTGHTWRVNCVAASADGRFVVSGDDDKVILLRDATTGHILQTIRGHRAGILAIDFRPDSRNFVSASWDKTIKIWETETGRLIVTLPGHGNVVWAVRYSPDGNALVSGGMDWTAKVWDAHLGGEMLKLTGHSQAVTTIAWSPDGERLASGGSDLRIHLWDTRTGEELLSQPRHAAPIETVAFDPGGQRVYALDAEDVLVTIDPHSGAGVARAPCRSATAGGAALDPGGLWLTQLDEPDGGCLRRLADGASVARLDAMSQPPALVATTRDGACVALADANHTISVWDTVERRMRWSVSAHPYPLRSMGFDDAGRILASCSEDRSIKLWDADTGTLLHILTGHESGVDCADFSPDGRRLVSGGDDRTLKVWDTATGQEVLTLRGHDEGILDVRFSPDGRRIASASADWTIRIWETGPPPGGFAARGPILDAQMLVFQNMDAHQPSSRLKAYVQSRSDLTPQVRAAALRLVDTRGDNPDWLDNWAWTVVRNPNATTEEYELALQRSATACAYHPELAAYHRTHGVALYRNAKFAEAITALELSMDVLDAAGRKPTPADLAFKAMAEHSAGTEAEAQLTLARLPRLYPFYLFDTDARALMAEATAVLHRPARPGGGAPGEPAPSP